MALPALKDLFPEHFFVNPDLTAPPPPQSIITNESASAPAASPALNAQPSSATAPEGVDLNSNIDPVLLASAGHARTKSRSDSIQSQSQAQYRPHPQQHAQGQEQQQYTNHERPQPQHASSHPHHSHQQQQQQQQQQPTYPPPAFPLSQVRPRVVAKRRFDASPPPLPPPPPQELEFAHVQFDNYPPFGSGPGTYPYQQRRQQYAGHAHDPQTEVQRARALTNPALANPSLNPSYLPGAGGSRSRNEQGGPGEYEQEGYAQGQGDGLRRNGSRGGNGPTTTPSNGRSNNNNNNGARNTRTATHTRRISDTSVSDVSDASDGGSDGSDDEYYDGNARRGGDGDGEGEDDALKRRHPCPRCGKRFNRPSSLKIHLNTHTGDKPYECPFPGCGRSFNVSSNMRRHYRNHSRRDTPPPLPANAYPVVSREQQQQMMNNGGGGGEAYPALRNRGAGHAGGDAGGRGYGPYGGGVHPSQYMNYGYMHPGSYMGMGGMNGMGMGMNGMNGGMGMGMGGGMDGMPLHPGQMNGMGMHPGEMGMHPGMGMYPGIGMGMNPGHWMGMGMGPGGMNGASSMGNGGMGGMSGMGGFGGGGMDGVGGHGSWGPPVSNTRGDREEDAEKTRSVGLGISDAQAGDNSHDRTKNGAERGRTNGPRTGTQPGTHPADPPTPPYTNEPPSPPPVLRSDSVWEDAVEETDGAAVAGMKRAFVNGDSGDGRAQKRARVGEKNGDENGHGNGNGAGREGEVVYYSASGGSGGPGPTSFGNAGVRSGATGGEASEQRSADKARAVGLKKGELCQPSPETPSMRNLEMLGEEVDGGDNDGLPQHKYRHAESHMRQSSIEETPAPLLSSPSQSEGTHSSRQRLPAHARSLLHPGLVPETASSSASVPTAAETASSDEGTHHTRYFPGPTPSVRDDGGEVVNATAYDGTNEQQLEHAMYNPVTAAAAMQMPFPCYTFPPPMPMPMGLPAQSGAMNAMGGLGASSPAAAEPPMAGLGPPPPEEGDLSPPPPLASSLDNKGLAPSASAAAAAPGGKRAFSVCPPARSAEGPGAEKAGRGAVAVGRARVDDEIDPTLR